MTILIIATIFWAYMRIMLPEQKRRQALQEAAWYKQQESIQQERLKSIMPKIIRETKTVKVAWNAMLGGYEPVSYSIVTEKV